MKREKKITDCWTAYGKVMVNDLVNKVLDKLIVLEPTQHVNSLFTAANLGHYSMDYVLKATIVLY